MAFTSDMLPIEEFNRNVKAHGSFCYGLDLEATMVSRVFSRRSWIAIELSRNQSQINLSKQLDEEEEQEEFQDVEEEFPVDSQVMKRTRRECVGDEQRDKLIVSDTNTDFQINKYFISNKNQ
jgi:hypothetical protein